MAFLRRANVRRPHTLYARVELHRVGSTPINVFLKDISCWEEHRINENNNLVFMWFTNGSMISVAESFEDVDAMVNSWEVAP